MGLCKQANFGEITVSISGSHDGSRFAVTIWDTTRRTKRYTHMVTHTFKSDPAAASIYLNLFGFMHKWDAATATERANMAVHMLMDLALENPSTKGFATKAPKLWQRAILNEQESALAN